MSETPTAREVFLRMIDGVPKLVAGDASQADVLASLYAEQTRVEHPMAPVGDTPILTREAMRKHFAEGPGKSAAAGLRDYRAEDVVVHESTDPEVVVAEFTYRGTINGKDLVLPCVYVLRVRDGLIIESRNYTNHLEGSRVFGRLDQLFAALKQL
ncbi:MULTISPECIES: nuclear transport factor 2 family protein [unclassified Streptomyces]|uniref:nuclear transport factor 2 family protein n=1 Tax=unclassified Streptomyces TaxID=2593676 RepID=UPI002966E622|nr:nuclear transport factor 2 family protein [Streptomyces sp. SJL17-1]